MKQSNQISVIKTKKPNKKQSSKSVFDENIYNKNLYLHSGTRLKDDVCYNNLRTYQSSNVGQKILETPGFKPKQLANQYANELSDVAHYPKQYRNAHNANLETQLLQSSLTKFRQNQQLFTRPYLGQFMGPGQNGNLNKDLETNLLCGEIARIQKSNNLAGITIDRFDYLPACCFPQLEQNIIMNGMVRGGEATRDFVRRNIQLEKTGSYYLH